MGPLLQNANNTGRKSTARNIDSNKEVPWISYSQIHSICLKMFKWCWSAIENTYGKGGRGKYCFKERWPRENEKAKHKKINTPQWKVFNSIKEERTYFANNIHIFTFLNWESPWDPLVSRFRLAFSPVPFYIFLLLHLGPSSKGQPSRWNDPQLLKCQGSMAEGGRRWRKYRSAHGTCQFNRGMEGSERHTEGGRVKWKVQSPDIVTSVVRGSHSLA